MEQAYLDNSATTRVSEKAAQKALLMMTEKFGNPSSVYSLGLDAERELNSARETIAKRLGADKTEIFFTSCGTEANNLAIFGAADARKRLGNKIITSAVEHPSVLNAVKELERRGFKAVYLPVGNDGKIRLSDLERELDDSVILVSVMAVNNETGARQDIAALAKGIKAKNSRTHFHVDAVQAWLRIPIDLQKWPGVDTLSVSGHKIHAPKGIGALFVRDSQRQTLHPPYVGGHQERGMRPGTENTPYIVGLGLAAAKGAQRLRTKGDHLHALNRQLRTGLAELPGITLNSPDDAVDEVVNFSTGCINSQTFINYLNGRLVFVSGGSACDKGEPSHTLQAMGCDDLTIRTALRVSFCADNTPEDVDALLDGLRAGLRELQHI